MLPAAARLTNGRDFRAVVRRGRRAGRRRLVLHVLDVGGDRTQVGFVVSKAVGNSVVRHRVARRLRHLTRDRMAILPVGGMIVVRALQPAGTATSAELGADLDAAWRRVEWAQGRDGSSVQEYDAGSR